MASFLSTTLILSVKSKPNGSHTTHLNLLQRQWRWVTAVYLITLFTFFLLLRNIQPSLSTRWLTLASVTAVYCLWVVWRHLPENYRKGETDTSAGSVTASAGSVTAVLPQFGWGNQLTLLRGLLISMLAGFLLSPWPGGWLAWLPALLYTTADIADFLDGYAARKTNHATLLGERLDMEFDGLGILLVSLLAVWYGQLPGWYLLIGLARYFFVFGLWLRQKRHLPHHAMPHSWHRRIFAGFQMGFMSVVLWPIVPPTAAAISGTIFALATSASFLRDWLVVVGWLNPQSAYYTRWQRRLYRLFARILPPVFRLIFAGCIVGLMAQTAVPWQPTGWATLFSSWRLPWPTCLASLSAVIGLVATVMITLGVMGRLMCLIVVFPIGFDMVVNGPNWLNGTALACAIFIMLLGGGAWSVWRPEERFMVRRAGERDASA